MPSKNYTYRDFNYSKVKEGSGPNCSTVLFVSPEGEESRGAVYHSGEESFHQSCKLVIDQKCKTRVYDLHSNFDIQKHKETYFNYLEVVILAGGKVSYAVPSHQRKLEEIACLQKDITREELLKLCPRERYLDYNDWLLEITGCISVWTDFYQGKPNEYQLAKLEELKEAGIYYGSLEPGCSNY